MLPRPGAPRLGWQSAGAESYSINTISIINTMNNINTIMICIIIIIIIIIISIISIIIIIGESESRRGSTRIVDENWENMVDLCYRRYIGFKVHLLSDSCEAKGGYPRWPGKV